MKIHWFLRIIHILYLEQVLSMEDGICTGKSWTFGRVEEWTLENHLFLQGARQVGKTYAILEFGRTHYENVAYFNFWNKPKAKWNIWRKYRSRLFNTDFISYCRADNSDRKNFDRVWWNTALWTGINFIKIFYEERPDYHIIVAGSLLGVAVNRARFSFPVGKVDMKTHCIRWTWKIHDCNGREIA